jgi:multidrug efflux pump
MDRVLNETLPNGFGYEWTDLTFQQKSAGSTSLVVFPICVLLVFLILSAQYESWGLPLAVILIVPMCVLFAMVGVWLKGSDNNVLTQIGFIVLVGLACKNAILIVEFARDALERGLSPIDAAIEACRLRLRPILMTSFAFIMGVVPLVTATGAGSEMRQAIGIAVFSGMLGVTLFGLFLTPVFFVTIENLGGKRPTAQPGAAREPGAPGAPLVPGSGPGTGLTTAEESHRG